VQTARRIVIFSDPNYWGKYEAETAMTDAKTVMTTSKIRQFAGPDVLVTAELSKQIEYKFD